MLFDLLCKMYEKTHLQQLPRQAKLFVFNGKLPEVSKDNLGIVFPYNTVAYEYQVIAGEYQVLANNCILISNVVEEKEAIKDMNARYTVVLISQFPNPKMNMRMETIVIDGYFLESAPQELSVYPTAACQIIDGKMMNPQEINGDHLRWFNDMTQYAIDATNVLSEPSMHIVKQYPAREHNSKLILRSHQRPIYTVVNTAMLQTRYELGRMSGESGITKSSHFRRAHKRLLTSERFTSKRGQYVKVKHTWIGPSETIINNRRYQVILDPDIDV